MSKQEVIFSFYEFDDYRLLLAKLIQSKQRLKKSLTQIAADSGIQPSYLSSVVNEKAHLSQDQLYSLSGVLGVSERELDYLLLLLEWERSGLHERKKHLKRRIDEIRDNELRIEKILEKKSKKVQPAPDTYYLDPHLAIVHIYLLGVRSKHDLQGIAQDLRLSIPRVRQLLEVLIGLGLVKRVGERWEVNSNTLHLPSDSPLVRINQMAFRALALERITTLAPSQHYSFGATLNVGAEDLTKIRIEFLKFIEKCKDIVAESDSTRLMQLNFDLFPWVD